MDPQLALEQRAKVEQFQRKHRVGLLTLLFTDLVGSTRLKQELGDREAVALIQRHHALVREILVRFKEGEEIGTAGDSFFIVFTKPSDAVQFSLLLQNRLRAQAKGTDRPLLDRVGIHIGEVVVEERADSAKPKDLYGLQVDICARVMSLAEGDQILLTRSAFDNARQVLKGQEIEGLNVLQWLNHGQYLLKGVEEPMEVCEVGEFGEAILKPPPDSEKVHRYVSPDSEPVLGWRPALEQKVPGTQWTLEEKLGEGGFGEVWLGRHSTTKEQRVFKFCFRTDRVRALKREVTLFRLLKERVGEHPNVVRLLEVFFEEPPYYLEMEYVAGRDLKTWCEARGRDGMLPSQTSGTAPGNSARTENGWLSQIPLETRLEIVAQVAEALQAAHDAGVIHRDIKPSNILIAERGMRSAEMGRVKSLGVPPSGGPVGEASAGDTPIQGGEPVEVRTPNKPAGDNPAASNHKSEFINHKLTAKLTDFGIGQVVSEEALAGLTRLGFTQTMMSPGSSAQTGTQIYMAPEVLAGKPASTRSDIYSLGVVLYQLLVGDFSRPLTTDWACEITDPLLRDDLKHCFAGNPQERFSGAGQLAQNLRTLSRRRTELEHREAEKRALERAAYRRGLVRAATVATLIIAVIAALAIFSFSVSRKEKRERTAAQHRLYVANMNLAQQAREQHNFGHVRQLMEETALYPDRGFEWYYWQRQTHLDLRTLRGHRSAISSVVFSQDGQRIVTGSWDGTAKVWVAASGEELFTLKGHTNRVTSLSVSRDGQRIVTGSSDKTAKVWEAASGEELVTLKGHSSAITSVAFSPDGQRIVTASEDQTAKVWETASGRELLTLNGNSGVVQSVAFSPDGRRIVTGHRNFTTKVWEAASGKELVTLKGHSGSIYSVAFSPDGRRIVTGSLDRTAKVWEAASGKELITLRGHSDSVISVAFSPDGQRIVTGSGDHTAKVWDGTTGNELFTLEGHSWAIFSVAFSPDGQWIATGSRDQMAKVWEATSGRRKLLTLEGHSSAMFSVAFSPDGKRIMTGSWDQTAKVWEAASGRELLNLRGHSGPIFSVAFSPEGQWLVTGSRDETAKVWESTSGRELITLKGHSNSVMSVAFSPNSQRVVTGSWDRTAKVWEATSGQELLTLTGHSESVVSVAFSPDSQRIVTGSLDHTAKVWDTTSGRELLTLTGHSDNLTSAGFSPDGQRIVTGSEDRTALVWEAASGKELATLKGHSAQIWSVAFSPDGRRIVTGSLDGTTKVWEAISGRELLTLKGHSRPVRSVAYSRDGRRIVTGSEDHTAKVWEAASEEEVAAWRKEEQAAAQRMAAAQQARQ
ncbi:MAG: protein kinase [Verrucomicrobia bacterium]|nr:protein kinase [Verrucomicrobiota bacterium]